MIHSDLDNKCSFIYLAPTKVQGTSLLQIFKDAQEDCKGKEISNKVLLVGEKLEDCQCDIICITADSQEDWNKVKKEWNDKIKDKCKAKRKIVCAGNETKAKKWCDDMKADLWMDMSKHEDTFEKIRKELTDTCKMTCDSHKF